MLVSRFRYRGRVLKGAAEGVSEQAVEHAGHGQKCAENEQDADDFVQDARPAFGTEMLFSPLDPAEVIDQPLGLEYQQRANGDDDDADEVFHSSGSRRLEVRGWK